MNIRANQRSDRDRAIKLPVRSSAATLGEEKMNEITYKDIDSILFPWAKKHSFHVFTECKDEEVRSMILVDCWGDQYGIYSIPDWENGNETVAVGADLDKRGSKKHTFYRERKQFHFRKSVELKNLENTLEEALELTRAWGTKNNEDAAPPSEAPDQALRP